MPTPIPVIDRERLWGELMLMACMGSTAGGGNDRLTLTDADRDARDVFRLWCEQAGLAVTVDGMGNMFGRREGKDPSLPPVLIGSHLDTQSPGGRFDGVLGVLAALEAVRALNRAGIVTKRAIEVVNWTNEEGARFRPGLMGSAVFAGLLDQELAHASVDRAGKTFGGELERIRYKGATPTGGRAVDSYLELHVEQGSELESQGLTIAACPQSNFSLFAAVAVKGENAHAQTTPMARRRNALAGAARLIEAIERIGHAQGPAGAASATTLDVWPNNRINIAHRAELAYSMVHAEEAGILAMRDALDAAMASLTAETGLEVEVITQLLRTPVHMDAAMTALIEAVAEDLNLGCTRLPSWTGHDALNMARIVPTALFFIPSRGGVSHAEGEYSSPEHCAAGAEVLLHAALKKAGRA